MSENAKYENSGGKYGILHEPKVTHAHCLGHAASMRPHGGPMNSGEAGHGLPQVFMLENMYKLQSFRICKHPYTIWLGLYTISTMKTKKN